MIPLQDIKNAIDQLSPEERAELRDYLEQQETPLPNLLSPDERIRRLDEAARQIREGFSDAEWDAVEKVMNEEYVEQIDDDGFPVL